MCKRIIIVNHGKIVLDDTMEHLKYHYLNKKIVEIKTKEEGELPEISGVTVIKSKGVNLKLMVDTTQTSIHEVLRQLDTESLQDINISNIPLENIITQIYKEGGMV